MSEIDIYPNPASVEINIRNVTGNGVLKLYDATGRVVYTAKLVPNDQFQKVFLPKLANGIYTFIVQNEICRYTGKINIIQND